MVFKLSMILAAVIVAFFLYLFSLNQEAVSIRFSGAIVHEFPIILLLAAAFLLGFLLNYLILLIRGIGTLWSRFKTSKERRALETADKLTSQAKRAIILRNWQRAEELLNKSIATSSHSGEPYLLLMECFIEAGDLEAAARIAGDIPHPFENSFEVLMAKAQLLIAREDFQKGAELLRRASEQESDVNMKRLMIDVYMKAGKWDIAASLHEEIRKDLRKNQSRDDKGKSAHIAYETAKAMAENGSDGEAVKRLKELTKRSPAHTPPYVTLGNLQWKSGKRELAEETWRKGFDATKNIIFLFLLEDLLLKEEDPQRIIDIYRGLIIENPDNPLLHLFLGKLFLRLEMADDAIESLGRAKDLELDSIYLSRLTGEALFRKGDFRKAAERFKEAMGSGQMILIPFVCVSCGKESFEWEGLCPGCGEWDALNVSVKVPGEWA